MLCASCGPLALAPVRAASTGFHKALHPKRFVPTSQNRNRQLRRDDYMDEGCEVADGMANERPDLDYRDDFESAMAFDGHVEFERLAPSATDDAFLALRRKEDEDGSEHRARLNELFNETFVHYGSPEQTEMLVKRSWLPPEVARIVFPNHVYGPPKDCFFPHPLHVAVLANNVEMAELLLRFTKRASCDLNAVFLREHAPDTHWAEISPLFLALLIAPDDSWKLWLRLFGSGGAHLSKLDITTASNVMDELRLQSELSSHPPFLPFIDKFLLRLVESLAW